MPSVQVDRCPDLWNVFTRTIQAVVHQKAMPSRQSVQPIDCDGAAALGLDRRTRGASLKSPNDSGREVAVKLLPKLGNRDSVMWRARNHAALAKDWGQKEWVDKGLQPHANEYVRCDLIRLSIEVSRQ